MLTQISIWLNQLANVIASVVLAPIAWLPGWLSATAVGAVTGVVMLVTFKYTSNQAAIKHTRSQIKASLLALSLFKEDLRVSLRSQMALLFCACRLLTLSLLPMLVMLVPMCLVLGQLALWFQARPLHVGEETIVTVHLKENGTLPDPHKRLLEEIKFDPGNSAEVTIGPVRVASKNMICWNIVAKESGLHMLKFQGSHSDFTKELAIGRSYMPVSMQRPASHLSDVLLHPRERPFAADSLVQSIEVTYPNRDSFITGTDWWMLYWFGASMIAAFAAKPFLGVNL